MRDVSTANGRLTMAGIKTRPAELAESRRRFRFADIELTNLSTAPVLSVPPAAIRRGRLTATLTAATRRIFTPLLEP